MNKNDYMINTIQGEVLDLRIAVKTHFVSAWQSWSVSYVDEENIEGQTLLRNAKTQEEALIAGIKLVKQHGFIPSEFLWH